MKNKLIIVILVFLMASINSLNAQTSVNEIPNKFLELVKNDPIKAMDYVFSTNKWMDEKNEGVANLKSQFVELLPQIGDYYGHELIAEKNIGENYRLISYLLKYERQPVRFTFILYNPNGKWQLQNLLWDMNVDDEIQEAANQNRN